LLIADEYNPRAMTADVNQVQVRHLVEFAATDGDALSIRAWQEFS
jgi:hypothetical protein